jgi:ribosomal protein S18 acetylase RimI-like enzyme
MNDAREPAIAEMLKIRPAVPADRDRMADIINDPPATGSVAIAGSIEKAVRAGRLFARYDITPRLRYASVAELDGRVIAVLECGAGYPDLAITAGLFLRMLVPVLQAVGPGGLSRFVRSRGPWNRVGFPNDPESYYIAELDVDSVHRNRGIGGVLLRHAEVQARGAGCPRMTLTTNITNPAQHLYERFGFRIRETKTDAEYERYSGSPGRVLMVKDLA